jgi:hypothetical protein
MLLACLHYRLFTVAKTPADKLREKIDMPAFSGSYTGRVQSQSVSAVPDVDGHTIAIAIIPTRQKSSDPLWEGAEMTYCATTDTIGGNGSQRGYFINQHPNGDRDHGTFEGNVTTTNGSMAVQGTWKLTGGTGMFASVKGTGTFQARMTTLVDVEGSWTGTYELQ